MSAAARRRVIIESPYAGDVDGNVAYLQACIRDSIMRGESPFASHWMYTRALNDADPDERKLGIEAGFAWREVAVCTVFYTDRGWSDGMLKGLAHVRANFMRYEVRSLHGSGRLVAANDNNAAQPGDEHGQGCSGRSG